MQDPVIILSTLGVALAYMTTAWGLSLIRGKVDVVDSFWGPGFALVSWFVALNAMHPTPRTWMIAGMITFWAARLAIHLAKRNWNKPEDRRYKKMRDNRPTRFWWVSLFMVFWLQALLLWLVSLVAQLGQLADSPPHLTWLDAAGMLLWAVGLGFEGVADHQLAKFKADPANKGKVMDQGLWGLSRHPNYFGESLIWWGIYLMALSTPNWLPALISPVLITFLLLKVSGVAMTEKSIEEHRPEYAEYKRRVSAFVPWPPKKRPA